MPAMNLPEDTCWTWNPTVRAGKPVDVILDTAANLPRT